MALAAVQLLVGKLSFHHDNSCWKIFRFRMTTSNVQAAPAARGLSVLEVRHRERAASEPGRSLDWRRSFSAAALGYGHLLGCAWSII